MRKGWHNSDGSGFLAIMYRGEKDSLGYNLMVIGSVEKEDLQILRDLPKEVTITFTKLSILE